MNFGKVFLGMILLGLGSLTYAAQTSKNSDDRKHSSSSQSSNSLSIVPQSSSKPQLGFPSASKPVKKGFDFGLDELGADFAMNLGKGTLEEFDKKLTEKAHDLLEKARKLKGWADSEDGKKAIKKLKELRQQISDWYEKQKKDGGEMISNLPKALLAGSELIVEAVKNTRHALTPTIAPEDGIRFASTGVLTASGASMAFQGLSYSNVLTGVGSVVLLVKAPEVVKNIGDCCDKETAQAVVGLCGSCVKEVATECWSHMPSLYATTSFLANSANVVTETTKSVYTYCKGKCTCKNNCSKKKNQ